MNHAPPTTPVHEVMTQSPISVTPDTTVGELMALFDRHDFSAFPVTDRQGVLRGIVAKLDVLRLFRPDERFRIPAFATIASTRVRDIMRPGVITLEPGDSIVGVGDLMVETRLRSVPVVERRSGLPVLVGIVSQGDVLRRLRFAMVDELQASGRGSHETG